MQTTLRIKKVYFDAIARHEKLYELRKCSEFYRRMFENKTITRLMLHYQRSDRVYCDVTKIERIRTPSKYASIIETEYCYKLTLENAVRVEK